MNQQKFRMTFWPGVVVPLAPVMRWNVEVVDGDRLFFGGRIAGDDYLDCPDQLYLFEAAKVPLDDVEALVEFSRVIAPMTTPLRQVHADLPQSNMTRALAVHSAQYGRRYSEPDHASLTLHVDDIGYRLRVLRQLSLHAQAYASGDHEREAWPDCDSDAEAWRRFTSFTNAALRAFHVRVWVDNDDPAHDIGAATPTLYEAAVLQLINDMQEHVEYRRCGADGCDQVFVRQRGKVNSFSRSSGVIYCTKTHADAQAQRERRRRLKGEVT